jgi:hypothetical protein
MTKDPVVLDRLNRLIKAEAEIAQQNAIFQESGVYHAFGIYEILKKPLAVIVTVKQEQIREFSSIKTAISWCVAEKNKNYTLSRNLETADFDTIRLANDVAASQALLHTLKDRERRRVVRDKLEQKQAQLTHAQERLSKCINLAKYFQLRGFNDELARTRRQTPNQTNRPRDRKSAR